MGTINILARSKNLTLSPLNGISIIPVQSPTIIIILIMHFMTAKSIPCSASINRQYIYLQIPLTLGYDFIRTSIIRIGIRIGPTLSVLIQTTPIQEDVSHGKDRIVQINDISWDRISTNYQFNGGIAAGIRLTRIFELEAEPVASYYFNSVYEKGESDKKPWSVGLRVSILIRNR